MFKGNLGLGNNKLISFVEICSSFGVSENGPLNSEVFEMGGTDLSGICSEFVVRAVLGSHLDVFIGEPLVDNWDMKGDGCDNDI